MKDFTRVFDVLDYQISKYPQKKAVNYFKDGEWKSKSINEIKQQAEKVSGWLIDNDFNKEDKVAVVPRMGSSEWLIVELACQQAGLITVPIHPTASVEDVAFILNETQARMCISADLVLHQKISSLAENASQCKRFYHLENNKEGYFYPLSQYQVSEKTLQQLKEKRDEISPEDTLVILYTSGTSGTPKGVVLTHDNVVSSIKSVLPIFPLAPSHRVLSFLPFSHVFERTASFVYLAFGVEIYYCTKLDHLNYDFKTVKPYFCTCVPKTLERMTEILDQKLLEKNVVKRKIIRWAMDVGEKFKEKKKQDLLYPIKLFVARLLVLRTFRQALGGKIKYIAVGAAALRPQIGRILSAAGIQTLSGYGMTETSPFISVNRPQPGLNQFGTVGIPVPGVEVKIDEPNEQGDGEILVKGPNVMRGYYNNQEQSKEVFTTDHWLRTGDVGHFEKRFLVITDRKKDIFKTSSGKYVAPQPLENHFSSSPFISQSMILGFNLPFVSALLVPNFGLLKTWCEEQDIHWTSPTYMVHNIKVVKKMQEEVNRLNEFLQNHERVIKFILIDEEWTVESKDLTTSFKPKRNHLLQKHSKEIDKLYRK